jgi:hypothetical protein
MKLFILAELWKGYMWNSEVYSGKVAEVDDIAAGVVKRLLEQLTNKGHTVYIDCFYTWVDSSEHRPCRDNNETRKGLPKALKKAGVLPKGCSCPVVEREEGCMDAEQQRHCPDCKDFQQAREGKAEATGCCC